MSHSTPVEEDSRPDTARSPSHRWWSGAPAVSAVLVAVVLLASLLWGQLRHQLALSFTRIDPVFSELYFPGGAGSRMTCQRVAAGAPMAFSIGFRGGSTRSVIYTVTLQREDGTGPKRRRDGSATGGPGDVVHRRVHLTAPARLVTEGYDVRVRLRGTDQELLVHCPAVHS